MQEGQLLLSFFLVISPERFLSQILMQLLNGLKYFDIMQNVASIAEPLLYTYQ